jgi:hypothetical protein
VATNPVERNFVTRYILGFAVIVAMMLGGGAGGYVLQGVDIPYAGVIGTALGALLVFAAFVAWYRRYDASYTSE